MKLQLQLDTWIAHMHWETMEGSWLLGQLCVSSVRAHPSQSKGTTRHTECATPIHAVARAVARRPGYKTTYKCENSPESISSSLDPQETQKSNGSTGVYGPDA